MGAEYLTSNALIAYPFQEDSFSRQGAAGVAPYGLPLDLFVDASFEIEYVNMGVSRVAVNSGVCLVSCTRVSSTELSFKLIVGLNYHDIVATLDPDPTLLWNAPYIVVEHHTDPNPLSGAYTGVFIRIVLLREALTRYLALLTDGQTVTYGQFQTNPLAFEQSTVDMRGLGVSSLKIYNDGPLEAPEPYVIVGDVTILSGNNIDGQQPDIPERDTVTVSISAIPGAGTGRIPCDPLAEIPVSNAPEGLSPQQGNIVIEGGPDGCYAVVPHPTTGIIQLQGRCQACCTCEDYKAYLDYLGDLCGRIRALHSITNDTVQRYQGGVTAYNATFKNQSPHIAVFLGAGSWLWTGHKKRGNPNWCRVTVVVTNRTRLSLVVRSFIVMTSPDSGTESEYFLINGLQGVGNIIGQVISSGQVLSYSKLVYCDIQAIIRTGGVWGGSSSLILESGDFIFTPRGEAITKVT